MVTGSWCVSTMTSIPIYDLRPWAVDGHQVLEAYLEPHHRLVRLRAETERLRQQALEIAAEFSAARDAFTMSGEAFRLAREEFGLARAAPAGQSGGTGPCSSGDGMAVLQPSSAASAAGGVGNYRAESPRQNVTPPGWEADGRGLQPPPPAAARHARGAAGAGGAPRQGAAAVGAWGRRGTGYSLRPRRPRWTRSSSAPARRRRATGPRRRRARWPPSARASLSLLARR